MVDLLNNCSWELMDTVPLIFQTIRVKMRLGHGANISIPQFRALRFIQSCSDSSLTDIADFLGLTLPSASKLVDGLVKQELIDRQDSVTDRRRMILSLTKSGEEIVNFARINAQAELTKILGVLPADELKIIQDALEILNPLFGFHKS